MFVKTGCETDGSFYSTRDEYCGHVTRCRVLIGHTGHLVPGEAHLVVILLRVAAGVSHGEAVPALGSEAPAATYVFNRGVYEVLQYLEKASVSESIVNL